MSIISSGGSPQYSFFSRADDMTAVPVTGRDNPTHIWVPWHKNIIASYEEDESFFFISARENINTTEYRACIKLISVSDKPII
jgi:hypothetical protein